MRSRGNICTKCVMAKWPICARCPSAGTTGSVDSTPLFVLLLGEYFVRTGDLETVRSLWPNAEAALRWIDTYGDRDGDGLCRVLPANPGRFGQSGLEGFP